MQIFFIYNCKCAIYIALMQCNCYKIVFNCAVWCFCCGDNSAHQTREPVSQSAWIICKLSGSPAALHPWVNQFGNSSSLLSELVWTWTWRQNERTRFYQQIKTAEKKTRRRQSYTQEIGSFIRIAAFCVLECVWVCKRVWMCVCAGMWFWWIMSLKLPRHWDFSTFKAETVRIGESDQPWCVHGPRYERFSLMYRLKKCSF